MGLSLSDALHHSTQHSLLCGNEFLDREFDSIDNIVKYVNDNGGFTIIVWCTLEDKSDASNNDSNNHELTGNMNYHVTNLFPTNKAIIESSDFKSMKFDVTTLFGVMIVNGKNCHVWGSYFLFFALFFVRHSFSLIP